MGEFRMPSLGADMASGTLVRWLVAPGDRITKGDVVAEVDTDKAVLEIEVFESGVIGELLVPEGTKVLVGTVLATILPEHETAPTRAGREPAPQPAATVEEPTGTPSAAPPEIHSPLIRREASELSVDLASIEGTGPGGKITRADVERAAAASAAGPPAARTPKASPYAKRLADSLRVDLHAVVGTGPDGSITASDVGRAAATTVHEPQPTPRPAEADRAVAMRNAIAALMTRSKREIPHYYLTAEVDMTHTLEHLERLNLERSTADRILPGVFLLKAVALACREFPEMNGHHTPDGFVPSDSVHLGVAISLRRGGLIAPAIHNADALSLDELMQALLDLVKRARGGRLRSSEMSDSTITVTNLGDQGVTSVLGVIYPPQVAIVGFGKILERPWAEGGMVGARPVVVCSLAADHRVSDGHRGGLFLGAIDRFLHHAEEL